jgi:hypothetical protein
MNRYIVLKYLDRLNLKRFKKTRNHFYFKCPLVGCGDLQSHKSNGRAYILAVDSDYPKFYCHKCGTKLSFPQFIKTLNESMYYELLKEIKDSNFNEVIKGGNKRSKKITLPIKKKIKIKKITDYLHPVSDYMENSIPALYLSKRQIPKRHWKKIYYFSGDPYAFFKKIFKSKKYIDKSVNIEGLLYPFYNHENLLYGFAIRNLDSTSYQRFFNLTVDDITIEFLGINKVDFNKKVYILEGIYDKLSFSKDRQILAMLSLNLKFENIPKNINLRNIIYVFDNEYDNKNLYESALKVIDMGFGLMIWDVEMKEKDINDLKQKGWNDDDFISYFERNTYYGFNAIFELNNRVRVFKERSYYV